MRKVLLLVAALALAGCATTETTRFAAVGSQFPMVRDGRSALISEGARTRVVIAPVARAQYAGERPTFVVAIVNHSGAPVTFTYSDISVVQTKGGQPVKPLHVYTVDELQREAQVNAMLGILLVGAAAAGGAAVAGNNINNPWTAAATGAAIGATAGNAAGHIAVGAQIDIAALETTMLKDNTLLPGEGYGGVFIIQPPAYSSSADEKSYQITFRVGGDVHVFSAEQVRTAG
jgi:hypothetical protein